MARPSRDHRPPGGAAEPAERVRVAQRPGTGGASRTAVSRPSTNGVRSTRCGTPSTWVVTTVSVTPPGQVDLLHRVGHRAVAGEQEPGAHGDPGRAVGQGGDQARGRRRSRRRRSPGCRRRRPPAAAARRWAPARCGRRPRRPARSRRRRPRRPPSPRAAGRPTEGITTTPASREPGDQLLVGASANDATLTRSEMIRSIRSAASAASARRLTPNGWSVRSLTSCDGRA